MRSVVSIFLLSLLLLQAIPVLHFFWPQKEIFYVYIDEEKPGDTKAVDEGKEFLSALPSSIGFSGKGKTYPPFFVNAPASPLLEYPTPPPDAC